MSERPGHPSASSPAPRLRVARFPRGPIACEHAVEVVIASGRHVVGECAAHRRPTRRRAHPNHALRVEGTDEAMTRIAQARAAIRARVALILRHEVVILGVPLRRRPGVGERPAIALRLRRGWRPRCSPRYDERPVDSMTFTWPTLGSGRMRTPSQPYVQRVVAIACHQQPAPARQRRHPRRPSSEPDRLLDCRGSPGPCKVSASHQAAACHALSPPVTPESRGLTYGHSRYPRDIGRIVDPDRGLTIRKSIDPHELHVKRVVVTTRSPRGTPCAPSATDRRSIATLGATPVRPRCKTPSAFT